MRKKGLDAREFVDGSLGLSVELVPAKHGRGLLGWLMGPVSGFYIAHPDEPSVYMTADSILTGTVLEAVERLQPELVIAPAGAANMGLGNLLFSVDELVELTRRVPGKVMFNHLESLDHCPTTRAGLQERMAAEGLAEKVLIPTDGELLSLSRSSKVPHVAPKAKASRKPGLQKWVSATFAGT